MSFECDCANAGAMKLLMGVLCGSMLSACAGAEPSANSGIDAASAWDGGNQERDASTAIDLDAGDAAVGGDAAQGRDTFDSSAADGGTGTDANIADANIADANIADADIVDADIVDADIVDADIVDADTCDSVIVGSDLGATVTHGKVLIIFDRSTSMEIDWGGMARWQVAGNAITSALTPMQDDLTIGAVFFPSDSPATFTPSCTVSPITDTTQLSFKGGAPALSQMQTGGMNGMPMFKPGLGQTPTLEALKAADAALKATTLTGTTTAILITDGEPNCLWDQPMAIDVIAGWAADGVKSYMVGVPGVPDPAGPILDAMAVAGGTGQHIAAEDGPALARVLHEIALQTIVVRYDSCTIALDTAATPRSDLHLVIGDTGTDYVVPHQFSGDASASWTLANDDKTVHIRGDLCTKLQNGDYEQLRFQMGCVDLPSLPRPTP